ncbi:hypothetical protein Btru_069224 [Bulinus truncatus]|nr:hypothetical protein Btru_069224 [Bulinus truncatus]
MILNVTSAQGGKVHRRAGPFKIVKLITTDVKIKLSVFKLHHFFSSCFNTKKGMFTTRSAVPQLKPNTIIKCVQVSEDHQWLLGDLASGKDGSQDGQELGSMLLRQGTCLKRLHSFFSQLESRKCCLHLACRRSTFNSIRVVPLEDDGVSSSKQPSSSVSYLDNKNLRTFKNAYMCAVFPVLAAPEPPITPSPAFMDMHVPSKFRLDAVQAISTSGYSSQDSGMEEADDAAVIPMEMVCEQLRRAFGLTTKLFHQYESLLVKAYARKSPQRVNADLVFLKFKAWDDQPMASVPKGSTNYITSIALSAQSVIGWPTLLQGDLISESHGCSPGLDPS